MTPRALTVEIHGTARAELEAARRLGRRVGVLEHRFVRLPDLREAGDIRGWKWREVPPTYIPMKNAIYYSVGAAFAEERGAGVIIGGHNADDRRLFKDTSEEFFGGMERVLRAGSERLQRAGLKISRPLKDMRKPQVVALAARLGVPLELTWSCHGSGTEHCWRCSGCRARAEAFAEAGVDDPLRMGDGATG